MAVFLAPLKGELDFAEGKRLRSLNGYFSEKPFLHAFGVPPPLLGEAKLSDIRFHSYGKNEEEEAFALHRNDFYRSKRAVDYHFYFVAAGGSQCFQEISVIEAHINVVAFDIALHNVAYLADGGGAGDFDFSFADGKTDGAFKAVVDKKAGSVDGVEEVPYFYFNHGIGRSGNGRTEIDEITLQES